MKVCIWCKRNEGKSSFDRKAHTIPQALGGKEICTTVCDDCNHYFGNVSNQMPAIETVIKETFNISRARFLASTEKLGKNKPLARFKSLYFNVDFNRGKFSIKPGYSLKKNFQEKICKQLKRGLFKIFLEELERQQKKGLDPKYDFIREFARYGIGDYPIFYFERTHGLIIMSDEWAKSPTLIMDPEYQFKYLTCEHGFFEFELLGHVFGLPTTRFWELSVDNYLNSTFQKKSRHFKACRQIKNFNDIDLTLNVIDQH